MSRKPIKPFSMTEQFEAAPESDVATQGRPSSLPDYPPSAAAPEYVMTPRGAILADELEAPGSTWTRPETSPNPTDEQFADMTQAEVAMTDGTHDVPATPKPGDSTWKDNNPKAAFGAAKPGIDYLSLPVLLEQAVGMMAGGYKYGAHNYLVAAPSVMTYVAACFRHLAAFVGGEELDPHAGEGVKVHHLVGAMNSLHVVRAAMINGTFFDDRPPQMPKGFIEELAKSVEALQKNNPDPVARYLANGKRGPGRILR